MAVIPSEGLREIACYEFSCIGRDDEQVLVYVNIETGEEEQILILLQDDTGCWLCSDLPCRHSRFSR